MHKSIVSVYAGDKESDQIIWRKDKGWLVEPSSLSHGAEVWAEYDGSKRLIDNGHQGRLRMRFHAPSSEMVFPEVFAGLEAKNAVA